MALHTANPPLHYYCKVISQLVASQANKKKKKRKKEKQKREEKKRKPHVE